MQLYASYAKNVCKSWFWTEICKQSSVNSIIVFEIFDPLNPQFIQIFHWYLQPQFMPSHQLRTFNDLVKPVKQQSWPSSQGAPRCLVIFGKSMILSLIIITGTTNYIADCLARRRRLVSVEPYVPVQRRNSASPFSVAIFRPLHCSSPQHPS